MKQQAKAAREDTHKLAAVLTLQGADKMRATDRRSVAKWLRDTARFLESRDVDKAGLSPRFRARLFR